MTIYMEEEQGERIILWQLTNPLEDHWNFGQFLLDHETNFRLLIDVSKSNGQDGFAAFDDILASIDMIEECEILPPEGNIANEQKSQGQALQILLGSIDQLFIYFFSCSCNNNSNPKWSFGL